MKRVRGKEIVSGRCSLFVNCNLVTKWSGWQRLIVVLLLLFLFFSALCTIGCEYEQYHNQFYELTGSIKTLLKDEKIIKPHSRTEYVLGSAQTCVSITVYGITDKEVIKKIAALFIDAHSKYPKIRYHLRMVTQTSEESHKSMFTRDTTILELTLNEEK